MRLKKRLSGMRWVEAMPIESFSREQGIVRKILKLESENRRGVGNPGCARVSMFVLG